MALAVAAGSNRAATASRTISRLLRTAPPRPVCGSSMVDGEGEWRQARQDPAVVASASPARCFSRRSRCRPTTSCRPLRWATVSVQLRRHAERFEWLCPQAHAGSCPCAGDQPQSRSPTMPLALGLCGPAGVIAVTAVVPVARSRSQSSAFRLRVEFQSSQGGADRPQGQVGDAVHLVAVSAAWRWNDCGNDRPAVMATGDGTRSQVWKKPVRNSSVSTR